MKSTYQTSNIDMFRHGQMVSEMYQKILKQDKFLWEHFNFDATRLLSTQHHFSLMRHYHLYHDCGKPFCKTIDEKGKIHYPHHAEISAQVHAEHFDSPTANYLIKNDMMFHTLKSQELEDWLKMQNQEDTASLYLSAWAEIFANSQMFGGFESDSFKIKKKKLNKAYLYIKKTQ